MHVYTAKSPGCFIPISGNAQPMHVGSIVIYNPETSPLGKFTEERLINLIELATEVV